MPRLERPCQWCHRSTKSKYGTCAGCRSLRTTTSTPSATDALIGGRWVSDRGGVLRWHPDPTPASTERTAS